MPAMRAMKHAGFQAAFTPWGSKGTGTDAFASLGKHCSEHLSKWAAIN